MEALILFEKALKQGKMPSRPLRVKKVEVHAYMIMMNVRIRKKTCQKCAVLFA